MAQDITSKTIQTSYKAVGGADQQKLTAKLYAEKSHSIAKILCINVLVCNSEAEVLNGEARVQSKIRFEVVYLAEDGAFYSITDMMDFTGRVQNELLKANMIPLVSSQAIDTQITSLSNDMVELTSIIDTNIDVVANDEVTFVEHANDRIVSKMEQFNYCQMTENENIKFRVMDEYEMKEDIGQLLMASAQLCNQQITPGTGYATIKGSVNLNLVYETNTEPKQIKSLSHMFEFKEEVNAQNVSPTSILMFTSSVMGDEINVMGNHVGENILLKTSIGLCYHIVALEIQEADALIDAFSLDNTIMLTEENFEKCKWNDVIIEQKRIMGNVVIDEMQAEIDNIVAQCGGAVTIANAYATNGEIQVEGVLHTNVIYTSPASEDEIKYESVAVEIPFSTQFSNADVNENTLIHAKVAIKSMQAHRKRSRELEVEVELCMYIALSETEQKQLVQKIEHSEQMPEDEVALRMFMIRKHNNLWDVCKKTRATPEMIMEQNPNLSFPLEEDTIIIIYKQKE
jgi:hypothetical protein